MTTFYLIRHGEPAWNITLDKKLHPCRHDFVPLTPSGVRQAEKLSKLQSLQGSDLILSSPYTRALQTASILSRELSLPISVEYELYERIPDTTFLVDDINDLFQLCSDWELHQGCPPPGDKPKWEPLSVIRKRITGVLSSYYSYSRVIVVFHEIAIRSIIGMNERIPFCGVRTVTDRNLSSLQI